MDRTGNFPKPPDYLFLIQRGIPLHDQQVVSREQKTIENEMKGLINVDHNFNSKVFFEQSLKK